MIEDLAVIRRFRIDGLLPGMNTIIKIAKRHHMAYSQMKQGETERCWADIKSQGVKRVTGPVVVRFHWFEPIVHQTQQRDVDNITAGQKFILDALVDSGVLVDDKKRYVRGIDHRFPDPSDDPHCLVEILECR